MKRLKSGDVIQWENVYLAHKWPPAQSPQLKPNKDQQLKEKPIIKWSTFKCHDELNTSETIYVCTHFTSVFIVSSKYASFRRWKTLTNVTLLWPHNPNLFSLLFAFISHLKKFTKAPIFTASKRENLLHVVWYRMVTTETSFWGNHRQKCWINYFFVNEMGNFWDGLHDSSQASVEFYKLAALSDHKYPKVFIRPKHPPVYTELLGLSQISGLYHLFIPFVQSRLT